MGSANETWEWVNLSEVYLSSSGDNSFNLPIGLFFLTLVLGTSFL